MSEHEGYCDDYCEECYSEGYDDGWNESRRTRKSSGGGNRGHSSDGCYVATAVYGSYDCPEVWTLRRFRDFRLRGTALGRGFVRFYYAVSPGLVRRFGHIEFLRKPVKAILDRFVLKLRDNGFGNEPYYDR